MAAESVLRTKSDDFALRIVNCFKSSKMTE